MSLDVSPTTATQTPRYGIWTVIVWILILGLAGLVVFANARSSAAAAYQKMVEDERVRWVTMLVVQMKSVEHGAASVVIRDQIKYLVNDLEAEASTPEDKLRIAIVAGESIGAEAALERLSKLSATSPETMEDVRSVQTIYQEGEGALTPEASEGLVRRHGYVGRLALAHGVPSNTEPRKSLEAEAFRFTLRLTVVGIGIVLLMLASFAAFVGGLIWFLRGGIRRAYTPGNPPTGVFLESFALYLVLYVLLGVVLRYIGPSSVQWTWTALLILPIAWMWVTLRGTSAEQRRQAFGWHRGRGVFREMAAGIGGYLAGMVLIVCGVLVTAILASYNHVRAASPIVQELHGGPWRLVGLYALACVFAPVMEETMFRGALFHHLRQRWGWAPSAILVSTIFAMLHPQGWVAIPALGAIAMVLAGLREWRSSLIASMTAHAFSNFLVLSMALLLLR
jgi:membrane protease YdiL (CAAX protease family)